MDDATGDGMTVINLSVATDYAILLSLDPSTQALEQAAQAGVIVVTAAGNSGPNPQTVPSPASIPTVIAVGSSNNDRVFAGSLTAGSRTLEAIPGSGSNSTTPITAPLVDVSGLDGTGLACGALPANSLAGSIAFILRGTCIFTSKLDNAQAAGAVAAVVYDDVAGEDPPTMSVGGATRPPP